MLNGFSANGGMKSTLRRPDRQSDEFGPIMNDPNPPNGGGSEYGGGGASLDDGQGSSASYPNTGPSPTTGTPPSPEALLSGGMMNLHGNVSPTMPTSPTPVGTMGPMIPNTLPSPSPRAMTSLSGSAGGLLGGGLGVAGSTGLDRAQPSSLIALLAALNGGR